MLVEHSVNKNAYKVAIHKVVSTSEISGASISDALHMSEKTLGQ